MVIRVLLSSILKFTSAPVLDVVDPTFYVRYGGVKQIFFRYDKKKYILIYKYEYNIIIE